MSSVKLPVYSQSGEKVGEYEINPSEIAPTVNKQLLHDAVVMYLANRRQGSVKTKSRGEVSGSTKKMYKQKGTGRARMGSKRTPQRRGGGHANSRQPRSWYYRLNRKAVQLATRMALAHKLQHGSVVVLDRLQIDAPKTKVMAETLRKMGLEGKTATLATAAVDRNAYLSGRNIAGLSVSPVTDLNALSILAPKTLVMTREAIEWVAAKSKSKVSA